MDTANATGVWQPGVELEHRWYVSDLQSTFAFSEVPLIGGGARSDVWT